MWGIISPEWWARSAQHCRDAPEDLLRNFSYPPLACFANLVEETAETDETHSWLIAQKEKWLLKWHEYGTLIKEGYD